MRHLHAARANDNVKIARRLPDVCAGKCGVRLSTFNPDEARGQQGKTRDPMMMYKAIFSHVFHIKRAAKKKSEALSQILCKHPIMA